MWNFIYSREFSGLLALLNGWFCVANLNAGHWGWAAFSGFFTYICAAQYFKAQ